MKKKFSFITFRPCKHLDGKHSIFGRLVGGGETLTLIEQIETNPNNDAPLVTIIKILNFIKNNKRISIIIIFL